MSSAASGSQARDHRVRRTMAMLEEGRDDGTSMNRRPKAHLGLGGVVFTRRAHPASESELG